MRNIYLLPLLLLLTAPLVAQQRPEFGITAKAGNCTLPQRGPGPQPVGSTYSRNALSAGFSTGLGIYGKVNVRPTWGLTAELLYSVSAFRLHEAFSYDPQFEQYILLENDWMQRYTEHNLLLPLKLHFHLGPAAKTVLAVGVAPSFTLQTQRDVTFQLTGPESLAASLFASRAYFFQYQEQAVAAPRLQWLFTSSVHRRVGARMAMGIDLTVAPRPNNLDVHFAGYADETRAARSPFSMKSLAVSLQYCLLR